MNKGKTIFSQIMSLIPERDFKTCVDRYKGNYRARNFSCKDQFLVMSYAQLTGRDSLRDIENCLTALSSKLYHCGISYAVPRNTLAKANEKRDWHIYKDFADVLLKKVRPLYVKDKFRLDLDNMVYAFDSSTISLCLKLCPWAKVLLGSLQVWLFLESLHLVDFIYGCWLCCGNIAIACFRAAWLNTDGNDGVLIGGIAQCLAEHSLILRGINDESIGWCHHDVGIGMLLLDFPAGISNTWSGIASLRLC